MELARNLDDLVPERVQLQHLELTVGEPVRRSDRSPRLGTDLGAKLRVEIRMSGCGDTHRRHELGVGLVLEHERERAGAPRRTSEPWLGPSSSGSRSR
jgi:hypothetical protein